MNKKSRLLSLLFCAIAGAAAWAQLPFTPTTIVDGQFAAGTRWYTMSIGSGQSIISDNGTESYIALGSAQTDLEAEDLWCFVGNDTDGYSIYNKQAGTGKVLASSSTMSVLEGYGGTGGTTYPTLTDASNIPSGYVSTWDFTSSDKLEDIEGYFMLLHGTQYAVNNFGGIGKLAFWAEGKDANSTVVIKFAEVTLEINETNGEFTASNTNKTWHSMWESNQLDGLKLGTGVNNMSSNNGYIVSASGTAKSSTLTLTAPADMCIAAYEFDFANTGKATDYTVTLVAEGKSYTSSATAQHVAVNGLTERTATFTQSGENKTITLSNFYVTVKRSVIEPEPCFEVFTTLDNNAIPYRIPAITKAHNGDLIAVADYRHSRADIGMATNGRIDLRARISKDNGQTWGEIFPIVEGKGSASEDFMHVGFGDPCIVADRESNRVLVMSCAGNVSFPSGTRDNHQNIACFYSENNGQTWSEPTDIAESIYSQFDNSAVGPVKAMFIGSGKIVQSYTTKVGQYYRLYCAVLCRDKDANYTNFVIYSDNFGETWGVLGGVDVPPVTSGGDEPKVEELPDGSILLSSRISGGRFYNIYSFSNSATAEGAWGTTVTSSSANNGVVAVSNSTNGEVICLPVTRKADNKNMFLLLQSVPFGSGRANVGIYYKELESLADFVSPDSIAKDWDGRHQSSYLSSAYSTMCWQADNKLAFLYEEDTYGTTGGGYTIVYKNYSIEQITDSAYTYNADVDRDAFVAASINQKTEGLSSGSGNYVGMLAPGATEAIDKAISDYQANPSKDAYEAINASIQNAPTISIEAGKWYKMSCAGRQNGTLFLHPESNRFTAELSNNQANADQLFTFVPSETENVYYIYNGNYGLYLGPLGNRETQPAVTADVETAGTWSITARNTGLSSLISENRTGSYPGLHLAGDCDRLVPWTATAEASLWRIEPVETYPVVVPESGYATLSLPFGVALTEGVKAYAVTDFGSVEDNECLYIEEVEDFVTCPVIIEAAAGTYDLPIVNLQAISPLAESRHELTGVLKAESVSGNIYLINGNQFEKRAATTGTVAANTAYFAVGSEAAVLPLTKDRNNFVGINKVETADKDIRLYDLNGRRVASPSKGIYVTSEGKKVFVK